MKRSEHESNIAGKSNQTIELNFSEKVNSIFLFNFPGILPSASLPLMIYAIFILPCFSQ